MDLNNNVINQEQDDDISSNHSNTDMPRRTSAERKSNKPLMEKRRRERINKCLDQLKGILMEVTKKESSYYSKLEKADILEMTVKYLKGMKKQQLSSDPTVLSKYIAGFNECSNEVTKYLSNVEGLSTDVKTRVLSHLANCLTPVRSPQQLSPQSIPSATSVSALPGSNNVCILNSGIQTVSAAPMQLLPAKLPSGETVYLLANSGTTSPTPIASPIPMVPQPLSPPLAHVSPTSTVTNGSFSSSDGSFLTTSDSSLNESPLNLDTKSQRDRHPSDFSHLFTPIAPKKPLLQTEKENQVLAQNMSFKKGPVQLLPTMPSSNTGTPPPLHLHNSQSKSMWRPW